MNILPLITKFSKEDSVFIQKMGNVMDDQWYVIPCIFQRVGEDLYRVWEYNNILDGIKEDIKPIIPQLILKNNELS